MTFVPDALWGKGRARSTLRKRSRRCTRRGTASPYRHTDTRLCLRRNERSRCQATGRTEVRRTGDHQGGVPGLASDSMGRGPRPRLRIWCPPMRTSPTQWTILSRSCCDCGHSHRILQLTIDDWGHVRPVGLEGNDFATIIGSSTLVFLSGCCGALIPSMRPFLLVLSERID